MSDDLLKTSEATVLHCVARAREEYMKGTDTFGADPSRQDAAIFNICKALKTVLLLAHHVVRVRKLGIAQSRRDVFVLLARAGLVELGLTESLGQLSDFNDMALKDDQNLQLDVTIEIIKHHLDDFTTFTRTLLLLPPH